MALFVPFIASYGLLQGNQMLVGLIYLKLESWRAEMLAKGSKRQ